MVKVKITLLNQHSGTIHVEYDGKVHTGRWDNNENVYNVVGDSTILKAALMAWDGPNEFELPYEKLRKHSGGWL